MPIEIADPTVNRRGMFAMLSAAGLAGALVTQAHAAEPTVDHALQERFALKRHAYQTGDAESLRSFYDDDIVIVGEGMTPLLGIEPVIAAYKVLLPQRRDIETKALRMGVSPDGKMAFQFVRFTAFAKDPAQQIPVVTFLFLFRRRAAGWRCIVETLLRQDLSLISGFTA